MLENIRIVLVGTSHPGNIGSSARAMKVMGLQDLCLVSPVLFPNATATAMASGADDLLARARVVDSLEAAVADCHLVLGTSARLRSLPWPLQTPREAARRVADGARQAPVAVVFGREKSGLSNQEIHLCQGMIHVPTSDQYNSLNLAMAVQIMAYELRLACQGGTLPVQEPDAEPARIEDLERLFEHMESALVAIGFLNPANPRHLMARLRRLFLRAGLDETEVNILRGMLSAAEQPRHRGKP
jgi:TrmH family RNA methyltransferase